jgi:hypothetical protein
MSRSTCVPGGSAAAYARQGSVFLECLRAQYCQRTTGDSKHKGARARKNEAPRADAPAVLLLHVLPRRLFGNLATQQRERDAELSAALQIGPRLTCSETAAANRRCEVRHPILPSRFDGRRLVWVEAGPPADNSLSLGGANAMHVTFVVRSLRSCIITA